MPLTEYLEYVEAMFTAEGCLTAAEHAEMMEMLASPMPTEEDMEAMYEEWCHRQEALACDGHKDSHYWV